MRKLEVMKERTLIKTKEEKSGKPTTSIKKLFLWKTTRGSWGKSVIQIPENSSICCVVAELDVELNSVVAASIDDLERMTLT